MNVDCIHGVAVVVLGGRGCSDGWIHSEWSCSHWQHES